jgi:uncharacterized LabA/DUF88 family protein
VEKCVILVDNSNVFIEGVKFSARQKGVLKENPNEKDPQDPSWRINFGALLNCLANGRQIANAILVGSRPPSNDLVWKAAEQQGFTVTTHERNSQGKEKAVDTELVAQGTEIICTASEKMVLVIASGDRDLIPLVTMAQKRGWKVEMCAFTTAYNSLGELAQAVDKTRPLDPEFSKIGHYDYEWPIPAS